MITILLSSGLNSSCAIGRRESASVEQELIMNTGVPQGCVPSPVLFSVYTKKVVSTNALHTLVISLTT